MEEYQVPVQEKKAFFSKKNLPLLIALAAAVVLVAALAVVLIVGSSPKAVAERFVKAGFNCDVEQIDKLCAYDFKALLTGDADGDEEEYFEEISSELDEDVGSWKELSKAIGDVREEEREEAYGTYTVEIKADKVKELSAKKLESLVGEKQLEKLEDFGLNADKIKKGAEVTVKVKIKGDDGKDSYTETVYLAKIGGRWKVLNEADGIVGGNLKKLAEKYIQYVLNFDVPGYSGMLAIDYEKYLIDLYGCDSKEEFYKDMSDRFDQEVTVWKDYCRAYAEDNTKRQEKEFGQYKISVEATNVKELSAKEMKSTLGSSFLEKDKKYGLDPDTITAGALVTVNAKIDGETKDQNLVYTVYMAKIGSSWKTLKVTREVR